MRWTIDKSSVPAALGAGPQHAPGEPYTRSFTLTGPDGMEATGRASADVSNSDILAWARNAHNFESVSFAKLTAAKADNPA